MEFIGTIETFEQPSEAVQKILGLDTILGTIQCYGSRYYIKAGAIVRNGTTGEKLTPGSTVYFVPGDGMFAEYVSWKPTVRYD